MYFNHFQSITLGISGVTAFGIGAFILAAPHSFFASYDIALGTDPNLLSELRAPGAGLAAFGVVMLLALLQHSLRPAAIVAALVIFLAFPAGRIVSIAVDGLPSSAILGALVLELLIAALCLVAFLKKPSRVGHPISQN